MKYQYRRPHHDQVLHGKYYPRPMEPIRTSASDMWLETREGGGGVLERLIRSLFTKACFNLCWEQHLCAIQINILVKLRRKKAKKNQRCSCHQRLKSAFVKNVICYVCTLQCVKPGTSKVGAITPGTSGRSASPARRERSAQR